MEYGAREASVQVYLGEAVLLGSMFVTVNDVAEFLNIGGRYLHLHQLMWFPYRAGSSAATRREAVIPKDEVLFVVHRQDRPPVTGAEEQRDNWGVPASESGPVEVATGRFVLRGCAELEGIRGGSAGNIHSLIAAPSRFFTLRDVNLEGPIGEPFTEPLVIVNADRVSFITIR